MPADRLSPAPAEDILGQVRQHLRREAMFPVLNSAVRWYSGSPRVWNQGGGAAGPMSDSQELAERLQALYRSLDHGFAASTAEIGEMPAVAPSFRGAVGRVVIGILQRAMWWYTAPLKNFAKSVGTHLQGSTEAIEVMAYMLQSSQLEIAALRDEVRRLREVQRGAPENVP